MQAALDDSWSGLLIWPRAGSDVHTRVQVTDPIRDPRTPMWPTTLRLKIVEAGVSTLEIQGWIRKNKAPTAQIKCADETDKADIDELVKLVRKGGGYATAQWEFQGKLAGLLLAPINKGLLCAAFPTTTMPDLPSMLRQVPYLQGNIHSHQTDVMQDASGSMFQLYVREQYDESL